MVEEKVLDTDAIRRQEVIQKLYVASGLCCCFMVVELIGGYFANSLAIMSDAAHLFADLAAFVVSIGASHLASLPSTEKHTYGLKRMESLAALFSMASLALVCVYLAIEALTRIYDFFVLGTMEEVDGKFMTIIAAIGVLVNIVLAIVLGGAHPELPGGGHDHAGHDHGDGAEHGDHDDEHGHGHGHGDEHDGGHGGHGNDDDGHDHTGHDHGAAPAHDHDHASEHAGESTPLTVASGSAAPATKKKKDKEKRNVALQAAYLHVLGDLLQSFAVLVAGLIIWFVPSPNVRIVDPLATLLFCVVVFYSTMGVIRSSIAIILEEVPPDTDWNTVYEDLSKVEGVSQVHDLHIWSISHGVSALSVHCQATDPEQALETILGQAVCGKHNIAHPTIQIQQSSSDPDCLQSHNDDKNCY